MITSYYCFLKEILLFITFELEITIVLTLDGANFGTISVL